MKDLQIDENFDAVIDDRNDLGMVEGREEFEQYLAHGITSVYYNEIGDYRQATVANRLQLAANRLAQQSDRIDQIRSIVVEQSETEPNTVEVSIVYLSDEVSTFQIS